MIDIINFSDTVDSMMAPFNPMHESHTNPLAPQLRVFPLLKPVKIWLPLGNGASFSVILSKYENINSFFKTIDVYDTSGNLVSSYNVEVAESDFGPQTLRKKRG